MIMTALLVIILLIFGLPYLWRLLSPLLMRWAQRRAQAYFRRAMGMPPEDGRDSRRSSERSRSEAGSRDRYGRRPARREPVIPKEYAEDVEFTESRTYSETTIVDNGRVSYVSESQVSDAEIIEIKQDK